MIALFPGQGAQFVGMGKDLFENFGCGKSINQPTRLNDGFNSLHCEWNSIAITSTRDDKIVLMLKVEQAFCACSLCTGRLYALGKNRR
jgi:malonyl CoA-acyl carrier protein transacylase